MCCCNSKNHNRRQNQSFFMANTTRHRRHCSSEHIPTKFHLRWQHNHSKHGQLVRHGCYGRLLCKHKTQQSRNNVLHHSRQRHFKLHEPKPRCKQARTHSPRFHVGTDIRVDTLRAYRAAIHACRQTFASHLPRRRRKRRHGNGIAVFAHRITVLFYGCNQNYCRRRTSRRWENGQIYDYNVHRSDIARRNIGISLQTARPGRHMVVVAYRLGNRHNTFRNVLLHYKMAQTSSRRSLCARTESSSRAR